MLRDKLLRSIAGKVSSADWKELLRDIVPSLMAWPDATALRVLMLLYSKWLAPRGLINTDIYAAEFLRNSLAAFDDTTIRSIIPASTLAVICPPRGNCQAPRP